MSSFTVNLSPTNSTVYSIGGTTPSITGATIHTSPMYNGSTWATTSASSTMQTGTSGQIALKGSDADITINGKSLKDAIENIEQRLNILTVNVELEREWAELKELGDRYRALEKEIKDRMRTWDILKQQE